LPHAVWTWQRPATGAWYTLLRPLHFPLVKQYEQYSICETEFNQVGWARPGPAWAVCDAPEAALLSWRRLCPAQQPNSLAQVLWSIGDAQEEEDVLNWIKQGTDWPFRWTASSWAIGMGLHAEPWASAGELAGVGSCLSRRRLFLLVLSSTAGSHHPLCAPKSPQTPRTMHRASSGRTA
jgi:hypothetical protein